MFLEFLCLIPQVPFSIILIVSGGQSQKMQLFPFSQQFGGDFDHGQRMRPAPGLTFWEGHGGKKLRRVLPNPRK